MPRLSLWLFIAASIGSACSLTSSTDDPARGVEFVIVPQPVARCDDPTYSPNCGLRYTGILTHRSTYEVGVPPSASEFLHLSFDDSLQTFERAIECRVGWKAHCGYPHPSSEKCPRLLQPLRTADVDPRGAV